MDEAKAFEAQLAAMLKQDTTGGQVNKSLGTGVKSDLASFIKKAEDDAGNDRRNMGRDDGRHNMNLISREDSLNFSDEDERDVESMEPGNKGKNYLSLF